MKILFNVNDGKHFHKFPSKDDTELGTVAQCECGQHGVLYVDVELFNHRFWREVSPRKVRRLAKERARRLEEAK